MCSSVQRECHILEEFLHFLRYLSTLFSPVIIDESSRRIGSRVIEDLIDKIFTSST